MQAGRNKMNEGVVRNDITRATRARFVLDKIAMLV